VFWVTAGNTLYFAVTQVALGTVVALLVALLLSQAMPGNGVMRTIVYLPQAMSYVVVALIWNLLYDPLNGPINGLLEALSFGPVNFLTDSHLAMPSIIAMSIWRNLGYFMIILLAGIQSSPPRCSRRRRWTGPAPCSVSSTSPSRSCRTRCCSWWSPGSSEGCRCSPSRT